MKKPLFNKICIVGVGLIGGSLGLAIKKRRLAKFLVGVARRKQSAMEAVSQRAVDMATLNLEEGVRGADLVILAGPIPAIISQIKILPKIINNNALVIDVGSSKTEINQAGAIFLKTRFIGCHPMAGSEKCGVAFADANLFQGAICFVTQTNKKVQDFWRALGVKPILITALEHDSWVAQSSHLPHALSFGLFQQVTSKYPQNPSLKDLSRLAKSDAEMWSDIFLSNCDKLIQATSQFRKDFSVFEKVLRKKDRAKLIQFIRHANQKAS